MSTNQSWRTGIKSARKTFIEQMNHRKRKQGSNSASLTARSLAYKTYTPVETKRYIAPTSYPKRKSEEDLDKDKYKKYIFEGGSIKSMEMSSGGAVYRPLKDTTAPPQDPQLLPAGTPFRKRGPGLNYYAAVRQPMYNLPH